MDDYVQRVENTLARRLIHVLEESGALTSREVTDLFFPEIEDVLTAERFL